MTDKKGIRCNFQTQTLLLLLLMSKITVADQRSGRNRHGSRQVTVTNVGPDQDTARDNAEFGRLETLARRR